MEICSYKDVEKLSQILKADGIITVPTDTVYGICAKINSDIAYNKLMDIKKRPIDKHFPIMCADKKQIESIALITPTAEKIIDSLMPGPITLILNKKENLPYYVNNGDNTIAIRMAPTSFLKELITKVEAPLFMSSANISGMPTCESIDEIKDTFPTLDAIVEGEVKYNKSSTIIDCTGAEIKILREGPISLEQINNVL